MPFSIKSWRVKMYVARIFNGFVLDYEIEALVLQSYKSSYREFAYAVSLTTASGFLQSVH